jgi:hypothetical protein
MLVMVAFDRGIERRSRADKAIDSIFYTLFRTKLESHSLMLFSPFVVLLLVVEGKQIGRLILFFLKFRFDIIVGKLYVNAVRNSLYGRRPDICTTPKPYIINI